MNDHQLKEYKEKLERERSLVSNEIKDAERPVSFGSGDADIEDEGSDHSEEVGNRLAVAQDLQGRLEEIDEALEKIRVGKYGICEKCGKEIEHEILAIDPESRFCKNDKAQN